MYSYLYKHRFYLINIPLIIYWIILFILTTLPGQMAVTLDVSDKIEHFGAYGLLSVFLYLNLSFQNRFEIFKKFPGTFTVVIASFYGLLDELHQLLVPGRSADVLDWLADFSGSLVAVLITGYIIRRIREIEIKKTN